jgi:Leucine-rich repeat (LRR) protein
MKLSISLLTCVVLTLIIYDNTVAQIRALGTRFVHIPVYRSEKDSIAIKLLNDEIDATTRVDPINPFLLDSLFGQWQLMMETGILRYRKDYKSTSGFFPYDSLRFRGDKSLITKISIDSKKLHDIPEDILQCINLQELEIVNSTLRRIQPELNALCSLKRIVIVNNQSKRHLKLKKNTSVTHLNIHGDSSSSLPRSYKKFEALVKINLSENGIRRFPNGARHNKKLLELDLQYNEITLKQNNIKPHVHLERLAMQYNKIESVPSSIKNVSNLKRLGFNNNTISKVAYEINRLQKLEYLSFYNNRLETIPLGLYEIKSLKMIDLFFNQLLILDDGITKAWPNLQILFVAHNQLSSLPENLDRLESLQEIHAYDNKLTQLPTSLCGMSSLKILRVNKNMLSEFPACFSELTSLEELDFSDNQINIFPVNIINFVNLKILAFSENPWQNTSASKEVADTLRSRGVVVHD